MGCRAWGILNFGSPVIATLERLDCDWEPHSCTFPDCGLVCAAVLGKARGAESHWDMRVGQPSRRRASAPEVCAWVRWRHAHTTRKDALGCAGGCAQLREETCALDHAMTLGCAGLVRR
ncbi:hypothetical protein CRG98_010161 [Punica granatum]|uniref:Uncharacterized protein n=1 Tax=Punica granatum TaxID=22663 RepID=A0A2I0KLT8_PUNGR|nr:hypothetical protein CRG98_010161 [Punica granatum]